MTRRTFLLSSMGLLLGLLCVATAAPKATNVVVIIETGDRGPLKRTVSLPQDSSPQKALGIAAERAGLAVYSRPTAYGELLEQVGGWRNDGSKERPGAPSQVTEGAYWFLFRAPTRDVHLVNGKLRMQRTKLVDVPTARYFLVGVDDGYAQTKLGTMQITVPLEIKYAAAADPRIAAQLERLKRRKYPSILQFGYYDQARFAPSEPAN